MKFATRAATVLTAVVSLSACATIFNGQTQPVSFQSVPEGAAITVTNRAGEKVHSGMTPVSLTLKRGAGYFKSETYTVSYSKDGFAPQEITVTGTMSGWYIGNILFGGFIGMLAVDPVTGAMYYFPDAVNAQLQASAPKTSGAQTLQLQLVSTASLTPAQLQQAQPLPAVR
ncbi:MAG: hypothetical protein LH480_08315 [Rubrivivax sp.]|nr:hypothetical protein [Rubrivivax sp.]